MCRIKTLTDLFNPYMVFAHDVIGCHVVAQVVPVIPYEEKIILNFDLNSFTSITNTKKNCENPAPTKPLFWIQVLDFRVLAHVYLLTFCFL